MVALESTLPGNNKADDEILFEALDKAVSDGLIRLLVFTAVKFTEYRCTEVDVPAICLDLF